MHLRDGNIPEKVDVTREVLEGFYVVGEAWIWICILGRTMMYSVLLTFIDKWCLC